MKMILLGCTGQLGQHVFSIARERGIHVVGITKKQLNIIDSDYTKLYNETNVDLIVNCAAYTKVDLAETESYLAYQVNHYALNNIVDYSNKKNIPLIHISTDYVYGTTKTFKPFKEDDECNPVNIYGSSKLKGENLIRSKCSKYAIIRTSWLYSNYEFSFPNKIISILKKSGEIKVVDDQLGTPTYCSDLTEFIISVANFLLVDKVDKAIYNYSNLGNASWYDFAVSCQKAIGCKGLITPCSSEEFETKAKRQSYSKLNLTNALSVISNIRHWQDTVSDWKFNYLSNKTI